MTQQTEAEYQKEIKRLESYCSNLHAVVKGDSYNIKRLSEENERLIDACSISNMELETLQGEIEMTYRYYAGFGAKKNIATTEMLNYILRTVPNYKPTKEEHNVEDMKQDQARKTIEMLEIRHAATMMHTQTVVDEAIKERALADRLAEALEWYRLNVEDCNKSHFEGDLARQTLTNDVGRTARNALQVWNNGKGWYNNTVSKNYAYSQTFKTY